MQTFWIYFHPRHGFKPIRLGFSWPAFFFSFLWAASCGLWRQCAWLVLGFTAATLGQTLAVQLNSAPLLLVSATCYTLLLIWPGLQGNLWYAQALQQQGFRRLTQVDAYNVESALRQAAEHLERQQRQARRQARPPSNAHISK